MGTQLEKEAALVMGVATPSKYSNDAEALYNLMQAYEGASPVTQRQFRLFLRELLGMDTERII